MSILSIFLCAILFASFLKLSNVNFSVLPHLSARPIHVGILELSGVCLLKISKVVSSVSFKDSVHKVALVVAAISPCVFTMTVFLGVFK